jgi:hypothetical protein
MVTHGVREVESFLRFSASDLVGHLHCHHLTALDAAVAGGSITMPKSWAPSSRLLWSAASCMSGIVLTCLKRWASPSGDRQRRINVSQVNQTIAAIGGLGGVRPRDVVYSSLNCAKHRSPAVARTGEPRFCDLTT